MVVYHWTTKENADLIMKNGLRRDSFVCREREDWRGEVLLEVDLEVTDWDHPGKCNWQRITGNHTPPERITVLLGDTGR